MSSPPRHTIVSVWTRCQAQVVDMIIVLVATSALAMIWFGNGFDALERSSVWVTFAVIGLLYFTLFEWRGGQTRPDTPTLRNDGTHASEQSEADEFNTVLESEIGRPRRQ